MFRALNLQRSWYHSMVSLLFVTNPRCHLHTATLTHGEKSSVSEQNHSLVEVCATSHGNNTAVCLSQRWRVSESVFLLSMMVFIQHDCTPISKGHYNTNHTIKKSVTLQTDPPKISCTMFYASSRQQQTAFATDTNGIMTYISVWNRKINDP